MTTIAGENRKTLRKAVNVSCGFQESAEAPTAVVPINTDSTYTGLANTDIGLFSTTLMDLTGSGFKNDGSAEPMQPDSDSFCYGYISEETAKEDGTFDNPPGLTIQANKNWDRITLELRGQYGRTETLHVKPAWSGGQATLYIERWTPGERVYITGVYLGFAWVWSNESLLSVTADLHGVSTEIGGELEVSSIEIQAYEPTDYTDVIGKIQRGAPIYYRAGYGGDVSLLRRFYLSEPVSWDDNVLTIKGQDATSLLDEVEVPANAVIWGGNVSMDLVIEPRVESALQTVSFETVGRFPATDIKSDENLELSYIFDRKAARSIIGEHTDLFRTEDRLCITYVDAGAPTIYYGSRGGSKWTICADEISEFDAITEAQKNALKIQLPDYYNNWSDDIGQVDAKAGKNNIVDLDPPMPLQTVYITPTPTSSSQISCERFRFKAAATTTYTLSGWQVLEDLATENDPYVAQSRENGEPFEFGFSYPNFILEDGVNLPKLAVEDLLNRSNITYEFTYRGNPKIQPRDILEVEVATWVTEKEATSGVFPALDVYPAADLFPFATYKTVRRMKKEFTTMTVDSLTLEHGDGGGFSSKITARKGVV